MSHRGEGTSLVNSSVAVNKLYAVSQGNAAYAKFINDQLGKIVLNILNYK